MTPSLIPDPLQMWREALTKLESNVNSLVTGSMDSQEVMRSVHQLSTVSLGLQQAFEKAIGSYLAKVNLPSRKDIGELAATLQRIEDKLDRLLPASAAAPASPRPARTRRPPPEEASAPPAKARAAAAAARRAGQANGRARAAAGADRWPHRRRPKGRADPALTERLRLEVERAIQRSLKGIELLGAPPPSVGRTPKTVLHRRGTLSLYHYHATADEVYRVPILFVMAPTNKAYILDLAPGQSLIEFLLGRGYDVYVMDWNAPSDDERDLKIEDYVLDFIPDCLAPRAAGLGRRRGDAGRLLRGRHALGDLRRAASRDGPIKNLVCFTTPIDFTQDEAVPVDGGPAHLRRRPAGRRASASFPPTSSSPASTRCVRRAGSPARCACGTTSGTTSSSRATG